MTRSIRRRQWHGVLVGGLLMLAAPTLAWAQTNIFPSSGNVGIGTMSPTHTLDVIGSLATANLLTPITAGIFGEPGGPNAIFVYGTSGSAGIANTILVTAGSAERLRVVGATGNVGIGTANPATKLHVAGDAQVDGNLAAKYQDVAEWVQASIAVPPGVVLIVDPQARNQVLPASAAYDTRVAGVVSSRPGLLLGEAGESKVKVAHSGRVKVKVDASYGAIAAGDLLVTSPTSGYAMRSVPIELGTTLIHRPGTVLGKALEPLETGQGEILVLLTLQ